MARVRRLYRYFVFYYNNNSNNNMCARAFSRDAARLCIITVCGALHNMCISCTLRMGSIMYSRHICVGPVFSYTAQLNNNHDEQLFANTVYHNNIVLQIYNIIIFLMCKSTSICAGLYCMLEKCLLLFSFRRFVDTFFIFFFL